MLIAVAGIKVGVAASRMIMAMASRDSPGCEASQSHKLCFCMPARRSMPRALQRHTEGHKLRRATILVGLTVTAGPGPEAWAGRVLLTAPIASAERCVAKALPVFPFKVSVHGNAK